MTWRRRVCVWPVRNEKALLAHYDGMSSRNCRVPLARLLVLRFGRYGYSVDPYAPSVRIGTTYTPSGLRYAASPVPVMTARNAELVAPQLGLKAQ